MNQMITKHLQDLEEAWKGARIIGTAPLAHVIMVEQGAHRDCYEKGTAGSRSKGGLPHPLEMRK